MPPTEPLVRLFLGQPIENNTEAACVRRLRRDLEALGIEALILANFSIGPKRRQIDLLVATQHAALAVELKGYIRPISGTVNGPWDLDMGDGRSKSLGSTNPYEQALRNRFAIADSLSDTGTSSEQAKRAIGGLLCLYPNPVVGSQIPSSDFKISIGGYSDLLELIQRRRTGALPIQMWEAFALNNGLSDADAIQPSAAQIAVANYQRAFQDFSVARSGPFVEPLFEGEATCSSEIAAHIENGDQFQILGPSGCGKTILLQRLACLSAHERNVPIVIRAGDFEGTLAPLFRSSIARFTEISPTLLFRYCALAGSDTILFVDAFNECPPSLQTELVGALQATRIRYGARIVMSSQHAASLPELLSGNQITLLQPDEPQAKLLVEAHINGPIDDQQSANIDVVATAQDAAIFAQLLTKPAMIDGRFGLYSSFTRARIGTGDISEIMRHLFNLATQMRLRFVSSLPVSAAERLLGDGYSSISGPAIKAGIITLEDNRVAFRHELLSDFFAASDILARSGNAADLAAEIRRPINAELREFVLGGCTSNSEIEALLYDNPDPRLLRSAIFGRSGSKAQRFAWGRMQDVIADVQQSYLSIFLSLPNEPKVSSDLRALQANFAAHPKSTLDEAYLGAIPALLNGEILAILLDLFGEIDEHLASEEKRLKQIYPSLRADWRGAIATAVYGLPFGDARHLHDLLMSIQNNWDETPNQRALLLSHRLTHFADLSIGQLFCLMSLLRTARTEPLPPNFPELLEHIHGLKVYHLWLLACDIIRYRGHELPAKQRESVRELLNSLLDINNLWGNTLIIDALEGVDGVEIAITIQDAIEEYEHTLALPESFESRKLAVRAFTQTYDHPFRDVYCEAFFEGLSIDQRQTLLVRGLRDEPSDSWFVSDLLRALLREPTIAAEPELQKFASGLLIEGHSYQASVQVFANAIAILAQLGLPLAPTAELPVSASERAWRRAAPLIYLMTANSHSNPVLLKRAQEDLFQCGIPEALDVLRLLTMEKRGLGHNSNVDFDKSCPDLLLRLCRAALIAGYKPVSVFRHTHHSTLLDEHVQFALAMIAKVGRLTDLKLVGMWLDHPKHGELALRTSRQLEEP